MPQEHSTGQEILIGVDTGGTFTDVVLFNAAKGVLIVDKTSSSPSDPSVAFERGIRDLLARSGVEAANVDRVLHGTTVATNLILENKGAVAAVLVTKGFKHVFEIGRHDIPRQANLHTWVKPKRPVPPQRIWEIGGRLDNNGRVVEDLDERSVVEAVREIKSRHIETIAVVLLHSYANPLHEQQVLEIIRREHPSALVSLSCEILPVLREYERGMTTMLNAYVAPAVSSYVNKLADRTAAAGLSAPLMLMKSSGGVLSAESAQLRPIETALSGPAAGVVGAAKIGADAGFTDLISIDIGGTSADICMIQGGTPKLSSTGVIGDWRVGLPMVDIMTIGAGGGSIARITASGGIAVGPESAGADPGPVCYRRGGTQPTVTDAHLVVGNLPDHLLGGTFELDYKAARDAVDRHIAKPLGISVEAAASGIIDIVNSNMVGAIRVVSVERGLDPRDFTVVAFGGAGPLHGCMLAREIGCSTVLIPPSPGVLAALGLLVANLKAEFLRTCLQRAGRYDVEQIAGVFQELSGEADAWFARGQIHPNARRSSRHMSLRYEDQGFELEVPWSDAGGAEDALKTALEAFHSKHETLYGFAHRDIPVEVVTLRVDAVGVLSPISSVAPKVSGSVSDAIVGSKEVTFEARKTNVNIYDRARIGVGQKIQGPAIITQLDTTSIILPGQTGEVYKCGSIVVRENS